MGIIIATCCCGGTETPVTSCPTIFDLTAKTITLSAHSLTVEGDRVSDGVETAYTDSIAAYSIDWDRYESGYGGLIQTDNHDITSRIDCWLPPDDGDPGSFAGVDALHPDDTNYYALVTVKYEYDPTNTGAGSALDVGVGGPFSVYLFFHAPRPFITEDGGDLPTGTYTLFAITDDISGSATVPPPLTAGLWPGPYSSNLGWSFGSTPTLTVVDA